VRNGGKERRGERGDGGEKVEVGGTGGSGRGGDVEMSLESPLSKGVLEDCSKQRIAQQLSDQKGKTRVCESPAGN